MGMKTLNVGVGGEGCNPQRPMPSPLCPRDPGCPLPLDQEALSLLSVKLEDCGMVGWGLLRKRINPWACKLE